MKEFIGEYGMVILEGLGSCIVIALLYTTFFNNGVFLIFISRFLTTLMGG